MKTTEKEKLKEEIEKGVLIKDKDEFIFTGKQLREWKSKIKQEIIDRIIEDYILMQNKYGLDFCPNLFIKHIKKLNIN